MDITQFGALLLAWEAIAKLTHRPTWTDLTARRSPLAIPIIVFWVWLGVHLWRAKE